MDNRTPAFCGRCGSKLRANTDVTGFDIYTGEAEESTELFCANPTVTEVSGRFGGTKTETTYHPSYRQVDGAWVQS